MYGKNNKNQKAWSHLAMVVSLSGFYFRFGVHFYKGAFGYLRRKNLIFETQKGALTKLAGPLFNFLKNFLKIFKFF